MWPWEHLAIGYLALSVGCRAFQRRKPRSAEALVTAFGTQFPDLVDKPLGWSTSLLPDGTSLAHSLLVAVPLVTVLFVVARKYGRTNVVFAFGLGYLLHLPADAMYPLVFGEQMNPDVVLWPLVQGTPEPPTAILDRTAELVAKLFRRLATPAGGRYIALEAVLMGTAVAAWLVDGRPGISLLRPDGDAQNERNA